MSDEQESAPSPWNRELIWASIGLAIALRLFHYLSNPAVWCDELWLLRNITGKSFLELLGPLRDLQAAPPLFLWAEHLIWLGFGDNIFALRFLPMLSSCMVMVLLVPLGRRFLSMNAMIWAILLLGFCDRLMGYTCDVKPYTTDALVAIGIPVLFFATEHWSIGKRLALFTFLAPFAIFLSYPACFVYGGLITALLPSLYKHRERWQAWVGFALLVATTIVAFALLVYGPVRAQRNPGLDACWIDFPNWQEPWTVPMWTLISVQRLFEHFWRPTGGVLMLPFVLGAIRIWRRGMRVEVLILIVPLLLALFAAWFRAYPFESRLLLFVMPTITIFSSEGIAALIQRAKELFEHWQKGKGQLIRTGTIGCTVLLYVVLLIPLGRTFYHLVVPMPRLTNEVWPEPRIGD